MEMPGHRFESLLPADRNVVVGCFVISHGLGQPPLFFKPIVGMFGEFSDRVSREELPGDMAFGQFEGHSLRAIFTELEGTRVFGVRPGASGAVETLRLVHGQKCLRALEHDALFSQRIGGCV